METPYGPLDQILLSNPNIVQEIAPAAEPVKMTFIQKNWGWVAAGIIIVIGGCIAYKIYLEGKKSKS